MANTTTMTATVQLIRQSQRYKRTATAQASRPIAVATNGSGGNGESNAPLARLASRKTPIRIASIRDAMYAATNARRQLASAGWKPHRLQGTELTVTKLALFDWNSPLFGNLQLSDLIE
jgi:hypothetical protein